ncbi:FAD/NAD(P)-binding protein [Devosia ginsengisoli]|uniref:FAD/NAD(P)-binding protein n=1 Tax=Devosia ginsengisoli TaxID=400770 RepID=UPI0026F2803D|nr:FAD/NAD(P)-binding protein [Devosia ginsengisoli]MCR6670182.1 FAD/NAD(P)-binding protein [Devosia ginsengisoli]
MTDQGRSSVTIIGGGASGVLLAAHLLRDPDADIAVTLLERRGEFGQGVAYSASQRDHKVNVPARGMSAFADDPDHFWRWLQAQNYPSPTGSWVFVPRRLYGTYLEHVLGEAARLRPGRLTVQADEAVAVRQGAAGVETVLANGTTITSTHAVLAVGHETQPARGRGIAVRIGSAEDTPLDPDAPVMILGSGLSMVDTWLSLAQIEHRGPILVVSRNGFLPKGHRDVPPLPIDEADVPFGTSLPHFLTWFRTLVADTEAKGGDWRSVIDGLRPFNQRIWQSWTERTKRQALRHLRPWWNIHRHRLPPEQHERLSAAIAGGQVELIAAEFVGIERHGADVRATIRPRGQQDRQPMDVARVYDCGGVTVDVETSSNPIIRDLIARGDGRPDPLHIGLDVDENCFVIAADGKTSDHLLAVGPLTRGRFFEIEAVPDIRKQCADIARRLLEG